MSNKKLHQINRQGRLYSKLLQWGQQTRTYSELNFTETKTGGILRDEMGPGDGM